MFRCDEQRTRDDRGGGGNVEGAVAVASRADDVCQAAVVAATGQETFSFAEDGGDGFAGDGGGGVTHAGGAEGDHFGLAVEGGGVEEGEEGGELDGGDAVREDVGEGEGDGGRGG